MFSWGFSKPAKSLQSSLQCVLLPRGLLHETPKTKETTPWTARLSSWRPLCVLVIPGAMLSGIIFGVCQERTKRWKKIKTWTKLAPPDWGYPGPTSETWKVHPSFIESVTGNCCLLHAWNQNVALNWLTMLWHTHKKVFYYNWNP